MASKDSFESRNTLGIGLPAYERLLEKLAEDNEHAQASAKRKFTRLAYLDPFVRVSVEGDSGAKKDLVLACRNLSQGGIGLLHSAFMYPGTTVTIYLPRYDGKTVGLRGKVVRIEHRGGIVHEVGVRFDRAINPKEFVTQDITDAIPSVENVKPKVLKGTVIFATEDHQTKAAVREHLLETSLKFKLVSGADAVLAEIEEKPDMLFLDLDLGSMSGPELTKKLRLKGIGCPVVLMGNTDQELSRSMVKVCGADALLQHPIDGERLLRVLGEFLLSGWDLSSLDKTRQRVDRATLVSLCFELNKLGVVMDQQLRVNDHVALFATCQKIRGLSMLVGMSGVSGMAERLGEMAANNADPAQMEELIEQVRLGCAAAGRAAA